MAKSKERGRVLDLLGISEYYVHEDRSMTKRILFGEPSIDLSSVKFDSINATKIMSLLSEFPFTVIKLLVSVMGRDPELEFLLRKEGRTVKDQTDYASALMNRVCFLTKYNAFPIRQVDCWKLWTSMAAFIALCLVLRANPDQNQFKYEFEIPSDVDEFLEVEGGLSLESHKLATSFYWIRMLVTESMNRLQQNRESLEAIKFYRKGQAGTDYVPILDNFRFIPKTLRYQISLAGSDNQYATSVDFRYDHFRRETDVFVRFASESNADSISFKSMLTKT
jgi:hypothetical protein